MRPIHLRIAGLGCFKDPVTVSFDGLDRFAISGATGVGKSTILDAVTLTLYGRAPRTTKDGVKDLISLGRDRLSVVFDFRAGGVTYRVTRVIHQARAAHAQLERLEGGKGVALADGVRAVEERVREIIGMEYAGFVQAVVLPQGQFAAFLKSAPGERRRMLNELLRGQVYERMRAIGAGYRDRHGGERVALERRIREDFAGVNPEAVAALEGVRDAAAVRVGELTARLALLRTAADAARVASERTRDLASVEAQLVDLRARRPKVEEDGRRLDAAVRAAPVLPLLDAAEATGRDAGARTTELAEAEASLSIAEADHGAARVTLDTARSLETELPGLRQRQLELAAAAALAPQLEQLRERCRELDRAVASGETRLTGLADERERLSIGITAAEGERATAEAERNSSGYDPALANRLEAVRDEATKLTGLRSQFATLTTAADRANADAVAERRTATVATGRMAAAGRVSEETELVAERTAAELTAGRDAHAAAHLRAGLTPGLPCPVCVRPVIGVPTAGPAPELEELRLKAESAAELARAARQKLDRAAQAAAGAVARAESAGRTATAADATRDECRSAVTGAEERLNVVAVEVAHFPGDHVEDRVRAAVVWALARRGMFAAAEARERASAEQVRLLRQRSDAAEAAEAVTRQEVNRLAADRTARVTERDRLEADIRAVTAGDPVAEQSVLVERIRETAAAVTAAAARERATAQALTSAQVRTVELCRMATEATTRAGEATERASEAIRDAAFADAGAIRAAILTAAENAALRQNVDGFEKEFAGATTRAKELRSLLGDRRVTAKEAETIRAEADGCDRELRTATTEQATAAEQARRMAGQLEQLAHLTQELVEHTVGHRVFKHLADDLQSDGFQKFLLEETLRGLTAGASERLADLTGGRLGLGYDSDEDDIVVIDHDNASERRSADTLSGGETFLASLALALELSAEVQRAAGAVSLDCLFIDEGFGTLDPETLRVVADALRGLQVGGRMVGVITHVPELRDEFDQRITVERVGGTSVVHVGTGSDTITAI